MGRLERQLIKRLKQKNRENKKLKKYISKLKKNLTIDFGTGVLRKRQGLISLNREMQKSKKYNNPLTIAFVDVDELRNTNDNFGHCEGDRLLKVAATIINENIRNDDLIFRYGGDEFIVLFKYAKINDAKEIWKRIKSKIKEENNKKKYPFIISLSAGFAEYKPSINLNKFISNADVDMYKNKEMKKSS